MHEKIKDLSSRALAAATAAGQELGAKAHKLADLNGDGRVDGEDARIAAERAGKLAKDCSQEATRIGKEALQTDLGKQTATGAAIGAAAAIPIPLVGPALGAAIGGSIGALHSVFSKKELGDVEQDAAAPVDLHGELLKLDELRQRGILTDEEFQERKRALLLRHPI